MTTPHQPTNKGPRRPNIDQAWLTSQPRLHVADGGAGLVCQLWRLLCEHGARSGQLIEQGSHEELIAHAGRYAELFELQARSYR